MRYVARMNVDCSQESFALRAPKRKNAARRMEGQNLVLFLGVVLGFYCGTARASALSDKPPPAPTIVTAPVLGSIVTRLRPTAAF